MCIQRRLPKAFVVILSIMLLFVTLFPLASAAAANPPRNGWWKNGDNWYYYSNGYPTEGWRTISGERYFFDYETYAMYKNCWRKENSKWYYFLSSGAMAKGWQKINNIWYWFYSSGQMYSAQPGREGHPYCRYFSAENKFYKFNTSGAMTGECKQGKTAHPPTGYSNKVNDEE